MDMILSGVVAPNISGVTFGLSQNKRPIIAVRSSELSARDPIALIVRSF